MKSEKLLRSLIREISSETPQQAQATTAPVTTAPVAAKQKGKIFLAGRDISGDLGLGFHSWIIVRHPNDNPGTLRTYSGKSGVGFETGAASAAIRKIFTGSARSEKADQVLNAFQNLKQSNAVEEYRKALENTTWGPLRKLKGWDSDQIKNFDELYELVPKTMPTITDAQILLMCNKIDDAFNNYAENIPYDPIPQFSSNQSTRNSNSFAYTLARIISPKGFNLPGFDIAKYPGWGMTVPGLATSL
jgi:hypothetical protein